jgi:CRP-like cAMP-binding protein
VAWAPARGGDKVVVLAINRMVFRNLVKAVPDVALRVAVAMSQRYARAAQSETLLAGHTV